MTPEEIRAHAEGLIRDHATDIEWLTIGETLPDSVPEDQADEVMKKVDDLIRTAQVTVTFPNDSAPGGLTDEQLANLDTLLDELPDGPWFVSDCEGDLQVWQESALLNVTRANNGEISGYRLPADLSGLLAEWDLDTWDPGEDERDDLRRAVAEFLAAARTSVPALLAEVKQLRTELAERESLANRSAADLRDAVEAVIEDGDSEVLAAMIVDRVVSPLAAKVKQLREELAREQEQVRVVRLVGEDNAQRAAYEAMDAERRGWQSRRAVENVAWSTARSIVEKALRKGYDIGGAELDDLAKALGLNGGEGQC